MGHMLDSLLNEGADYIELLLEALRTVEPMTRSRSSSMSGASGSTGYRSPAEFDAVISVVASDLGLTHLDIPKFRALHYERWLRQLELLSGGYEFEVEARRLIEFVVVSDVATAMPITGRDVIDEFGLEPGPGVYASLLRARELFIAEPCGRDELLRRLAEGDPETEAGPLGRFLSIQALIERMRGPFRSRRSSSVRDPVAATPDAASESEVPSDHYETRGTSWGARSLLDCPKALRSTHSRLPARRSTPAVRSGSSRPSKSKTKRSRRQ